MPENAFSIGGQELKYYDISVCDDEGAGTVELEDQVLRESRLGGDSAGESCGWWPTSAYGCPPEEQGGLQERDMFGHNWWKTWELRDYAKSVQLDSVYQQGGQGAGSIRK